jgi:hypothetical protein
MTQKTVSGMQRWTGLCRDFDLQIMRSEENSSNLLRLCNCMNIVSLYGIRESFHYHFRSITKGNIELISVTTVRFHIFCGLTECRITIQIKISECIRLSQLKSVLNVQTVHLYRHVARIVFRHLDKPRKKKLFHWRTYSSLLQRTEEEEEEEDDWRLLPSRMWRPVVGP